MAEKQNRQCELLVPAGGEQAFLAAVENGADAVYVGGSSFNARAGAQNFNREQMKEAVAYAHQRGVRVHVTMNILLEDDELRPALKEAEYDYEIGVDALIVQDLGLANLIHKEMPDFPLHLSTQATAYDLRCVQAAEELGFRRAVLSRELTFEEIRAIREQTDLELEMFIHGALCICYSGQCQMSRYFGGRSGNRGACAQPCRLPYTVLDREGRRIRTGRHPLSPRDLCLLDDLGDLIHAGIDSFKIEGRMKSPEYVAVVTSIYRKYIDQYLKHGSCRVDPADRMALRQIFNRGDFTEAYLHGYPGKKLMCSGLPKHQGVPVGRVNSRVNPILLDVRLDRELQLGDGIEIHNAALTGGILTYLKTMKGGLTRIGDFKGDVHKGDEIFRTSSKAQLDAARKTFQEMSFTEGKFRRKRGISMQLKEEGQNLMLRASTIAGRTFGDYDQMISAHAEAQAGPFPYAENHAASLERLKNALRKTGGTPFEVEELKLPESMLLHVRMAELNALRREVLDKLADQLACGRTKINPQEHKESPLPRKLHGGHPQSPQAPAFMMRDHDEMYFYSWKSLSHYSSAGKGKIALLPLYEAERHYNDIPELLENTGFAHIVPWISNVAKGKEAAWVEKHIAEITEHWKESGIYVGSLSWISYLTGRGIPVYADFGLNRYNHRTAEVLEQLGAAYSMPSLEEAVHEQGAFPLMTTQYRPDGDLMISRRKDRLDLWKPEFSEQTWILPERQPGNIQKVTPSDTGHGKVRRVYISPEF
ncbi:MAG: U32 family peptidase [Eubacterium sp.]